MARLKKTYTHYNSALTRLSAIKSIDAKLDLGNGLTVDTYEKAITEFSDKVNAYNTMLSQIDALLNEINDAEKSLKDLSERMLIGVAAKYGKNSNEYEQAGGVKKSERKKIVRKTTENKA
jgi:uncharacterized protein YukE